MMRPPTIAPGIEVKPPRISTGSALSAMISSANETSERAPQKMPVDQRDDAGGEPDDDPDLFERNADRERRPVAVGDRAQRAPDARLLEEHARARHHQRRR